MGVLRWLKTEIKIDVTETILLESIAERGLSLLNVSRIISNQYVFNELLYFKRQIHKNG